MSDSTVVAFPSTMNPADLAQALQQSKVQETSSGGGEMFIRFDFETGDFTVGKEREDITGEQLLVNTTSIKHGWILWSGGRAKKSMVPFTQPLPEEMEPIYKGKNAQGVDEYDYPSEGRGFSGGLWEDQTAVAYEGSSYGARKGVDTLLNAIKAKAATGSEYLYPLIELTSESYANAKRGGKLTYNPVFKVISWHDVEGNVEGETAQVEDQSEPELPLEEEAAPKKRRRRNAE